MKFALISFVGLLALSASCFAGDAQVDITSFVYSDLHSPVAELCGKVTGAPAASIQAVHVVVDPGSNPANYTVLTGPDGLFCSMVMTYSGKATASVWSSSANPPAPQTVTARARMSSR